MLATVAQISKSAVSPNCIRRGVRNSETPAGFTRRGLEIRDTAGFETRATLNAGALLDDAQEMLPNARSHLPLRHEVGKRAGERWYTGLKGAKLFFPERRINNQVPTLTLNRTPIRCPKTASHV
jgi:hypothetical protein